MPLIRFLQEDLVDRQYWMLSPGPGVCEIHAVVASSSQSSEAGFSGEVEFPASVSQKKAQRSEHPPSSSWRTGSPTFGFSRGSESA